MKFFYYTLLCLLILSCKKDPKISTNSVSYKSNDLVNDFINCDISGDYKLYFDHLSHNYKDLLKIKYKTDDNKIILDSLTQVNNDLHLKIKSGKFVMTNTIIDTFSTDYSGVSLIKYRSKLYDTEHKGEFFKIKMLLKISDSNKIKFIPYTYNYTTNIDSLIKSVYGNDILNKLKKSKKLDTFITNDEVLKKIAEQFKKYNLSFKKTDNSLFDFLYPPAMNELLKQNGRTSFTAELKTMFINSIKDARNKQILEFKNILVDDIIQLNCDENKTKYLLSYAIEVNHNAYIPGQVIVFIENNDIYFIEYDKSEFETTLSGIFDINFLHCLSNQSEITKKNLGVN